jgi:hypothetical protein
LLEVLRNHQVQGFSITTVANLPVFPSPL